MPVRPVSPGVWEIVPPSCARQRREDWDEVVTMLEAGENDIATDELRWLLEDCPEWLAPHRLLGDLAMLAGDLNLARGHYGIAFQLGLKALANVKGTAPFALPGNVDFHESGRALVECLQQLGKRDVAREAADHLLRLDPTDPLDIRGLLSSSGDGLLPIISG